jgi:hypothetical protein
MPSSSVPTSVLRSHLIPTPDSSDPDSPSSDSSLVIVADEAAAKPGVPPSKVPLESKEKAHESRVLAEMKRVADNWKGPKSPTSEECELAAILNLSSKDEEGKSYLDNEQQFWKIMNNLMEHEGLLTVDVEGTGSCLFHCMSILMFGDQTASRLLRVLTSLWLLDVKHIKAATLIASNGSVEDYMPVMLECMNTAREKRKVTSESWLEYCYKFAHDSTFSADSLHVGALVAMFGMNLLVYTVIPENRQATLGYQDVKIGKKAASCLRQTNLLLQKHGPYRVSQFKEHPMKVAVSSRHYRIVAQKGAPSEPQFKLQPEGQIPASQNLGATIESLLAAIGDILKAPPRDMPYPVDDGRQVGSSKAAAEEIVVDLEDETEAGEDLADEKEEDQEDEKDEEHEGNEENEENEDEDGEDVEECDDEGNVIVPGKKVIALANRKRRRSRSVARQRSRSALRRRSFSHSRSRPSKQGMEFVPKNPLERCYTEDIGMFMEREYDEKQEVLDAANRVAQ